MKIALITGANKGIGLETARQLGAQGITILVGARDTKRGQEAAQTLKEQGIDAQFLLIDPTDPATIEAARAEVEAKFGHLDILINNAGTFVMEDIDAPASVPTQALRDTYDLNVFGVHEVTRTFWPLLERSEAARLVNVSSIGGSLTVHSDPAGPLDSAKLIAYASSKSALNMMTALYAWQWKDTRHRANAIHPGNIKTDLNTAPFDEISLQDGAKTSVQMALIPDDGPNGSFSHLGETLPW